MTAGPKLSREFPTTPSPSCAHPPCSQRQELQHDGVSVTASPLESQLHINISQFSIIIILYSAAAKRYNSFCSIVRNEDTAAAFPAKTAADSLRQTGALSAITASCLFPLIHFFKTSSLSWAAAAFSSQSRRIEHEKAGVVVSLGPPGHAPAADNAGQAPATLLLLPCASSFLLLIGLQDDINQGLKQYG